MTVTTDCVSVIEPVFDVNGGGCGKVGGGGGEREGCKVVFPWGLHGDCHHRL